MKKTLFLLFLVLTAVPAFAQVTITERKVTYTRKKPIADHKKTFEITYPKIKAATPAVSRKIEAQMSYEKAFEFKLSEELGELQWLETAGFDVNYNANRILSVALFIEGSGAYPSASTRHVVINSANGTRVRPADVFTNTDELLGKIETMKAAIIKKALADIKNDPDMQPDDLANLFKDSEEYHKLALDEFEINEAGVTFHHDYGFPHAAKALEPDGEFFFKWSELKPFIKPGGLLAQFIR